MGDVAGKLTHVTDVFQVEAEACSHALQVVQNWGISRIHIETDSQLLVQALKNNDDDFGPCEVLIKEIKETLYLNFICFSVEYCPRAFNSVADALAAFGSKLRDETQTVWLGHAPDFVLVHVNIDVAVPV
jgi:ribonuclease HI